MVLLRDQQHHLELVRDVESPAPPGLLLQNLWDEAQQPEFSQAIPMVLMHTPEEHHTR